MDINNIFVVGAGTMGNGIAQVAATSGYQVTMMDVVPGQVERARLSPDWPRRRRRLVFLARAGALAAMVIVILAVRLARGG